MGASTEISAAPIIPHQMIQSPMQRPSKFRFRGRYRYTAPSPTLSKSRSSSYRHWSDMNALLPIHHTMAALRHFAVLQAHPELNVECWTGKVTCSRGHSPSATSTELFPGEASTCSNLLLRSLCITDLHQPQFLRHHRLEWPSLEHIAQLPNMTTSPSLNMDCGLYSSTVWLSEKWRCRPIFRMATLTSVFDAGPMVYVARYHSARCCAERLLGWFYSISSWVAQYWARLSEATEPMQA